MNLQVRDRDKPKSYFYKTAQWHLKESNDFNVKMHFNEKFANKGILNDIYFSIVQMI